MQTLRGVVVAGVLCAVAGSHIKAQQPPYQNQTLSPEARAKDLVGRMTLEEKAEQSVNAAPAISRLGVSAYDYWSEGLHGIARSGYSTLFPQAIGMASTWDSALLKDEGDVVSIEARAKYNEALRHNIHSIYFGLTIWSPNINIFRDPRWGRGQETLGEDPVLTGTLGAAFARGIQGNDPHYLRAIATPKHFAVHSGPESERHRFDVEPSPHDLWETYLPAFRRLIVDAKADSIMCAYNRIDGKPACASDLLLQQTLRGAWGFQGFVTSDCGAVDDFFEKSGHRWSPDAEHAVAAAVKAGTDTNCGSTYLHIPAAVKAGLLTEADVNRTVERLFEARMRLGMFDPPASVPFDSIPFSEDRAPEHLALSLKASEKSMVLLKNDGLLPLAASQYNTVAVVGPNAASLRALEGNYNAIPKDPQMPVDALREEMRGSKVIYAAGSPYADGVPLPIPRTMFRPAADSQEQGLKGEYFAGDAATGQPVATRLDHDVNFDWTAAAPVDGVPAGDFTVRWSGVVVPPLAGAQTFRVQLSDCYPCDDVERVVVRVDGKEVQRVALEAQNSRAAAEHQFTVDFPDKTPRPIEIEYTHRSPLFGAGLSLEWVPGKDVLLPGAVEAAKAADLVVAMVGLSPDLEGEEMPVHVEGFAGGDRTDIQLPAAQERMLEAVAATGKPLVVVLLNGSALAVNWAQEHANAVLEAWYPGEFGGKAIAETLTGKNNPAGRLPITFYSSINQVPPFEDYSMKGRTYRYFDGKPLYAFGYGLSYSKFEYSGLKLSTETVKAGDPLVAEVQVKNVGPRDGDEVAELYIMPPKEGNGGLSPKLRLAGFERLSLRKGEAKTVRIPLDARDLSEVDGQGKRSVQAGRYGLAIGGAQPGAGAPGVMGSFQIQGNSPLPQ